MAAILRRGALARAVCAALCVQQACASDVVQLSADNFTSTLEAMEASSQLVMEFYASWCPHCRHFAPTYEQIAHFFVGVQDEAPVTVSRVDCAKEVSCRGRVRLLSLARGDLPSVNQILTSHGPVHPNKRATRVCAAFAI